VHAKSTDELISFRFSDFTFWLITGLCPNLALSESLSERLINKNSAIANRSRVSCAHSTSRASIGLTA